MAADATSSWTIIDTIFKIALALIGGAWTLLTYLRGRTFRRRLEPKASGQVFHSAGFDFVSIDVAVKNVGLSRAVILHDPTWLRVFLLARKPQVISLALPRETRLTTAPVFLRHGWVEPGEEIHDALFLQLPRLADDDIALRLDLRIGSQELRWPTAIDLSSAAASQTTAPFEARFFRNLTWNTSTLVPLPSICPVDPSRGLNSGDAVSIPSLNGEPHVQPTLSPSL